MDSIYDISRGLRLLQRLFNKYPEYAFITSDAICPTGAIGCYFNRMIFLVEPDGVTLNVLAHEFSHLVNEHIGINDPDVDEIMAYKFEAWFNRLRNRIFECANCYELLIAGEPEIICECGAVYAKV